MKFGEIPAPEAPQYEKRVFPEYIDEGEILTGCIIGLRENSPINEVTNQYGTSQVINYRFRVVGGELHGYTVTGSYWMPVTDAGWHGDDVAYRRLQGIMNALDIDPASWEVPKPDEIEDAINGVGKWEDNGWLFKLISVKTGVPSSSQNGRKYTSIRYINPVDDNIKALLSEDLERTKSRIEQQKLKDSGVDVDGLDNLFGEPDEENDLPF